MTIPPFSPSLAHGTALPPTSLDDRATTRWAKHDGDEGYALIAEPDLRFADRIRALVAQQRLSPVIASNTSAALAILRDRGAPKLAIINVANDAFALLGALREQTTSAHTPLLVIAERMMDRKRAIGLKQALGIGAVASPHLSVATIDAMIDKLLDVEWVPPSAEVLELLLGTITRRFGVTTAVLDLVIGEDHLVFHTGPSADVIASSRMFAPRGLDPQIVNNAFEHTSFARHPLVKAGVVGSSVSVPIVSPRGRIVGSLTVVDTGPWLGAPALVDALCAEARGIGSMLSTRPPMLPVPSKHPSEQGTPIARILRRKT
jgi:hypothetical protein